MWIKYKWYILTALVSASVAFFLTSKSDESTYQKQVEVQKQTIDYLSKVNSSLKEEMSHHETDTTKKYDPQTGKLVEEETKVVDNKTTKDQSVNTETSQKTTTDTRETTVTKTESTSRSNTVLAGYGYDSDFSRVYSVEYVRRFDFLNVGLEVQSGKEVQASALIGISFYV